MRELLDSLFEHVVDAVLGVRYGPFGQRLEGALRSLVGRRGLVMIEHESIAFLYFQLNSILFARCLLMLRKLSKSTLECIEQTTMPKLELWGKRVLIVQTPDEVGSRS